MYKVLLFYDSTCINKTWQHEVKLKTRIINSDTNVCEYAVSTACQIKPQAT
jgi:hypothetical protein